MYKSTWITRVLQGSVIQVSTGRVQGRGLGVSICYLPSTPTNKCQRKVAKDAELDSKLDRVRRAIYSQRWFVRAAQENWIASTLNSWVKRFADGHPSCAGAGARQGDFLLAGTQEMVFLL
jgi:hypothetical protein